MLALVLLIQAIATPSTLKVSSQGQEVVDLFGSMCVETGLKSTKAHLLDAQPAIARPMTPDELKNSAPDNSVTEGWITKSPHDAWAALWFAPSKRTCGVSVRASDPAGMEDALEARLKAFYGAMGVQIAKQPDEASVVNGVTIHQASWTIDVGAHQLAVFASFGEKAIGTRQQHLMTITMLR